MKHVRATMIAAGILACYHSNVRAARVDYVFDAGIEHNSNIALANLDPISQRYLRAGLGFVVTEDVSALQINLTGRAEYRNYRTALFNDTLDGTLAGHLNWTAIPDRLFFTVDDSLSVQPVDALAPNAPGNRQQVNVISLGPSLLFNWTPAWHGRAEFRYIDSNAEVSNEFNADHVVLALSAARQLSETSTLSFLTQARDVDIDNDLVARDYRRYDLFARYTRNLPRFAFTLDAGYSRVDYQQGAGRSDPLLRANLSSDLTARSTLSATVSSQFSDTASDALNSISSTAASPNTVPSSVLTGNAIINASPYVVRSTQLDYEYGATRTRFSTGVFVQKRDYVDSDFFDQKGHGAYADVEWTLRPALTIGLHATRDNLKYTSMAREDKTLRTGANLRYQLARHWHTGLSYDHYKLDSTAPGQSVAQNIVYLSISYSNR